MFRSFSSFAPAFMASSQQPKGRGRQRTRETASLSNDVGAVAMTTATSHRGRGRGIPRRPVIEVPDPHWTVSDLSSDQFQSKVRPTKPTELGTIGQSITVLVNYFPIHQFPQEGFVYQYDIEIRNKNDRLIRRDHRR